MRAGNILSDMGRSRTEDSNYVCEIVGDGNLKTSSKGNARASGNARGGGGEQPMFSSLKGLFG